MITVKFFGMLSVDYKLKELQVEAGTIEQVLEEIKDIYPEIPKTQLRQAMMFVNQQQVTGNKRFLLALKDGDELAFLSPASGG
jgi:molybdopterin converting factor small subunit